MIKKEIKKHSSAIQMKNELTISQIKAWNILLANALPNPDKDSYTIDLSDFMAMLNIKKSNIAHLKNILSKLQKTQTEMNLLQKDKKLKWGSLQIIGSIVIDEENNYCWYTYDSIFKENVFNPKMYALLKISIQKKISSKYALILYELCFDYMDKKAGIGETPYINLYTFKKIMGISDEEYKEFKAFNRRVIKQPIEEINKVSDINVTTKYRKIGKKVDAIKFRTKHKALEKVPTGHINDRFEQIFRRLPEDDQKKIFQEAINTLSKFDLMNWNKMAKHDFSLATPSLQKKIIKNRNNLIKERY